MGFPFNEQLPNIGRVNKDYSFTIANTTYKSNSDGVISYQVENLPHGYHLIHQVEHLLGNLKNQMWACLRSHINWYRFY